MSIPVFVSIDPKSKVSLDGKVVEGRFMGDEIGINVNIEGERATLKEPFNNVEVSMAAIGLNGINVIVNGEQVHVLGNYEPDNITFRASASLGGTIAVCNSARLTREGETVRS
ncbi:MAG: hypothetical protein KDI33_14655 [Halioglobus sp.]|nr:hypothetical protein [Halioglobus sp.]